VADIHQLFDGMIATGHSNDQNGSPARPANYSDEALANRFTARHRDDLRFVNTWGRWLVWDGKRWQPDETLMVTDHAWGLVREASSEVLSQKLATVVASAKTVSAKLGVPPGTLLFAGERNGKGTAYVFSTHCATPSGSYAPLE
jgi:hypothetical protein